MLASTAGLPQGQLQEPQAWVGQGDLGEITSWGVFTPSKFAIEGKGLGKMMLPVNPG